MKKIHSLYFPGIVLFICAAVIGLLIYQDFGIAWDEPLQRNIGLVRYNYIFDGNQELFSHQDRYYGTGYELLLIFIEKLFHIGDFRDIFLMRHLVGNFFFLSAVFSFYVLIARLFKSRFIGIIGAMILISTPRIYAHSFFNSKDLPFLSMVIIALAVCRWVFEKDKAVFYFIPGIVCGYTTAIRIAGVMLAGFILFFLLLDLIRCFNNKQKIMQKVSGLLLFVTGFCFSVYVAWPFLWKNPVHNFVESFDAMSHFGWAGAVFFKGQQFTTANLPWNYFATWFLISNPLAWLIVSFTGIILLVTDFCRKPGSFLINNSDRNFILYLMCFIVPVIAQAALHSPIYDGWRHLYFVYPPFILAGLYGVNKIIRTGFKPLLITVIVLQVTAIGYFEVKNHPFGEVYFNETVSHSPEYLRRNYDLDYWGPSVKQALGHIAATDQRDLIKISWGMDPILNNIFMLPKDVRKRFDMVEKDADYLITNYRSHPDDYPLKEVYSIRVLNSKIVCVYKLNQN